MFATEKYLIGIKKRIGITPVTDGNSDSFFASIIHCFRIGLTVACEFYYNLRLIHVGNLRGNRYLCLFSLSQTLWQTYTCYWFFDRIALIIICRICDRLTITIHNGNSGNDNV